MVVSSKAVTLLIEGAEFSASGIQIRAEGSGREGSATFVLHWERRDWDQSTIRVGESTYDNAEFPQTQGISQIPVRGWDQVQLFNKDGEEVFTGFITSIDPVEVGNGLIEAKITCKDGTVLEDTILGSQDFWGLNDQSILTKVLASSGSKLQAGTIHYIQSLQFFDTTDVSLKEITQRLIEITGAESYVGPGLRYNYLYPPLLPLHATFSNDPTQINFHTGGTIYPFKTLSFTDVVSPPINAVKVKGSTDSVTGQQFQAIRYNADSIAKYGKHWRVIQANEIRSNADAGLLADLEISKFALPRITGRITVFAETIPTAKIGHRIRIVSPAKQFDEEVVVRSVTVHDIAPDGSCLVDYDFGPYVPQITSVIAALARRARSATWTNPKVQTSQPGPGSVAELQLADRAVTAIKIQLEAIQEELIAAGAVTETKIDNDAVTTPKIVAGAVTTAKIGVGEVQANNVAANAITGVKILAGSITASNAVFGAGAIQNADIGDAQISTAKIGDLQVTSLKIGDFQVTESKINSGAVTNTKLGNASITTAKIGTAQITTLLVADGSITNAKIASIEAGKITAGTITATVSMTSPNITSTSASGTVTIAGGQVTSQYSPTSSLATIAQGFVEARSVLTTRMCRITSTGLTGLNDSGLIVVNLSNDTSAGGQLNINSNVGLTRIRLNWNDGILVNGSTAINISRQAFFTRLDLTGAFRTNQATVAPGGSPAGPATWRIPVDSTAGAFLGFIYLYA